MNKILPRRRHGATENRNFRCAVAPPREKSLPRAVQDEVGDALQNVG